MSTISAGTTTTTALVNTGDTTGNLVFQTNGTTTAMTIDTSQNVSLTAGLAVAGNNISAVNSMGFRNRIINGDMRIDQRNAGAAVTPTDGQYVLDRWKQLQSVASKYSVQRNAGSVTPPTGFTNYLGVTSLSAYSVGSSEYFACIQEIEGFNSADLAWGTASAQTITVSFWVRSSLTGTFGGAVGNVDNNRNYPFTYSVVSANTWEQKSITIAGETTGTWGTGNGSGLRLKLGLGVGSTFSGTAGSWQAANLISATGATSVVGTNGATWYITGVQLEAGSVATPFERRDYGRELMMCQRYYYKLSESSGNPVFCLGQNHQTTQINYFLQFPQQMRAAPTLTASGASTFWCQSGGGAITPTTLAFQATTTWNTLPYAGLTGATVGYANMLIRQTGTAFIEASAEL